MLTWSTRLHSVSIALVSILFGPELAIACSNCFAASGANGLRAYFLSTAILTSMPFLLIAAICFACYKARRSVASKGRLMQKSERAGS